MVLHECTTSSSAMSLDYDSVKNIVDSNGHTYEWVPYSDRTTVNEGGLYVDTGAHMVYMYVDYDAIVAYSPSSWVGTVQTSPNDSYLFNLAPYSSNSTANKVLILHSTTATNDPEVNLYPYGGNRFILGGTKKMTAGENFKIWAVWSVRTAV